jgi:hypothetical protein
LRHLPEDLLTFLDVADRNAVMVKSDACADELGRADLAAPSLRAALFARAGVPDDYREWQQALGIYPLATLPFSIAINRWQDDSVETFRRAAEGDPVGDRIVRYEPGGPPVGNKLIADIFAPARPDRLGVRQLGQDDLERLSWTFAPVFEIATSGDDDRFGPLRWGTGPAPDVDVLHPTSIGPWPSSGTATAYWCSWSTRSGSPRDRRRVVSICWQESWMG